MVEPSELELKRAADRRLALLALAGREPEPAGNCPTEEEWAVLVEGKLAPDRRAACLNHLAACERCYGLWRQLDQLYQQQNKPSLVRKLRLLLGQPKILATTGTLLATAASVAVFLSLTTRVERSELIRLPESARQEVMKPLVQPQPAPTLAPAPAERRQDEADGVPAPSMPARTGATTAKAGPEPCQPVPPQEKAERTVEPKAPAAGAFKRTAPAGQGAPALRAKAKAEPLFERTVPEEGSPAQGALLDADTHNTIQGGQAAPPLPASAAMPPLSLARWQERIRTGCTEGQEADYFTGLVQEGKDLLRKGRFEKQERRRVERILQALERSQPVEARCRVMMDIIDQGGKEEQR